MEGSLRRFLRLAVEAAQCGIAEASSELLTLKLERLNTLTHATFQRALRSNPTAINGYLLVLGWQAALLGLAPISKGG
ncbi:hypothetical protein [Massilia litorea]|uniref:Uncharacterized protein n=1 Tax=Massilia litorea TaxID=2769491 RepID=A0A7L9U3Z8_9BURK|nr:hypothetical protein [Massilia litorea]QOL49728.1 hypothetical protein LPB04_23125 [Massilia litorea]